MNEWPLKAVSSGSSMYVHSTIFMSCPMNCLFVCSYICRLGRYITWHGMDVDNRQDKEREKERKKESKKK